MAIFGNLNFPILLLIFGNFGLVKGANILVFAFHDTGSHFQSMSLFFTRLANSGHKITLFDTINTTKFKHPNISRLGVQVPKVNSSPDFIWQNYVSSLMMPMTFSECDEVVFGPILDQHQEKLDQLLSQKWDLVIADALFIPHGHAIASRLFKEQNTPYILYETACQHEEWQMSMMSLGWNPITKPYVYLDPSKQPDKHYEIRNFVDRLWTFVNSFYETFAYYYMKIATEYPNVNRFGVDNFRYSKFLNDASFMFAERIDWMGYIMPAANNVLNVGASCPSTVEKLPKNLETFVEKSGSNGTLYIALGSYADWKFALPNVLESIQFILNRLPEYQIIFSYNGDPEKIPNLPNVKFVKWAPQMAILKHEKTKLFLSHGGLKSVKEAVCAGIPLLAMPLFAEQPYTADSVVKQNVGRVLHKHTVTGPQMFDQINELLNNPIYSKNIKKFREMYTDRPIQPLQLAEFNANRLLKTNSNIGFKIRGAKLSWMEYFNFDLFGLLSFFLLFINLS